MAARVVGVSTAKNGDVRFGEIVLSCGERLLLTNLKVAPVNSPKTIGEQSGGIGLFGSLLAHLDERPVEELHMLVLAHDSDLDHPHRFVGGESSDRREAGRLHVQKLNICRRVSHAGVCRLRARKSVPELAN